jgi:hypothetical protein
VLYHGASLCSLECSMTPIVTTTVPSVYHSGSLLDHSLRFDNPNVWLPRIHLKSSITLERKIQVPYGTNGRESCYSNESLTSTVTPCTGEISVLFDSELELRSSWLKSHSKFSPSDACTEKSRKRAESVLFFPVVGQRRENDREFVARGV